MNQKTITIDTNGIQAKIARKIGVCRATVNAVFRGKYTAGRKLSEKLEGEFVRMGIPLTRWDLMYGVRPGQTLSDYLKSKQED